MRLKPKFAHARSNMAKLLYGEGKLDAAAACFREVIDLRPADPEARQNLASVLAAQGKLDEAIALYQEALRLKPGFEGARANLAVAQAERQQWQQAFAHYASGDTRLKQQRTTEAIADFHHALRLRPDWPELLNNLAWLLATHPSSEVRNGVEAVPLAQRACELTGQTNLWMLSTLAASYAEAGRFGEAVSTQQKVCDLAAVQGPATQVESFQQRLTLYRAGQAYHRP
jgi:tetratricopeptide (TPR) repeat protein